MTLEAEDLGDERKFLKTAVCKHCSMRMTVKRNNNYQINYI